MVELIQAIGSNPSLHAPKTRLPANNHYISPDPDNADEALVLLKIAAPGS